MVSTTRTSASSQSNHAAMIQISRISAQGGVTNSPWEIGTVESFKKSKFLIL